MRTENSIKNKIVTLPQLIKTITQWRITGKKIAFTNGCFDILHEGHIFSLIEASRQADYLVVGLNADSSVKKLKGETRPINNENSRALVIAALSMVDAVIIFSDETPKDLIVAIMPDFLVKGGDYTVDEIAGAPEVMAAGGKVIINPILQGFSTTSIIDRMANKG